MFNECTGVYSFTWEGELEMTVKRVYQSDNDGELPMKDSLEDTVGSLETPTSLLYPRICGVWMNEETTELY